MAGASSRLRLSNAASPAWRVRSDNPLTAQDAEYRLLSAARVREAASIMKVGYWFGAGMAVTTLGGATLALVPAARSRLPTLQESWWQVTEWLGVALLAVGILLVAVVVICVVTGNVLRAVIQIDMWRGRDHYFISEAGERDLPDLYSQYVDLFGRELIPQDEFARWIKKNPSIAYRVWRQNSRNLGQSPEPLGFFDIEPLTNRGERRLRAERPDTLGITVADIHSGRIKPPHAYYVGSVGTPRGASDLVKGVTLTFLVATVEKIASQRAITVYARPATDEGLYLVKLFEFTKLQNLPDKDAIWQRVLPSGARLTDGDVKLKRFVKIVRKFA